MQLRGGGYTVGGEQSIFAAPMQLFSNTKTWPQSMIKCKGRNLFSVDSKWWIWQLPNKNPRVRVRCSFLCVRNRGPGGGTLHQGPLHQTGLTSQHLFFSACTSQPSCGSPPWWSAEIKYGSARQNWAGLKFWASLHVFGVPTGSSQPEPFSNQPMGPPGGPTSHPLSNDCACPMTPPGQM